MPSGSSRVVKYRHVKENLAAAIEGGAYHLGERLPSEKELAEQFGVSIITIRQAVEALSREGYVEKIQGSGTYVRHLQPIVERKVWGLALPQMRRLWYASVCQGLADVGAAAGVQVVVTSTDGESMSGESLRRLVSMGVEGIVVVTSWVRPLDPEPFRELAMAGVPFVLVGRGLTDLSVPRVVTGADTAGRMAAEHLLALGHQRIAFFSYFTQPVYELMWEGLKTTLTQAGLSPWPQTPTVADGFSQEDMYRGAREILAVAPRPTAVMCTDDFLALAVCHAARDARTSVPEELSVVGFGEEPGLRWDDLTLTTVSFPKYDLGREAGRLLLRQSMGEAVPPETVMPVRLRRGQTSGPAPVGESLSPSPTQLRPDSGRQMM